MAGCQPMGEVMNESHRRVTLARADMHTENEFGLRVDGQPHTSPFQRPTHIAQQFVQLQDVRSLVGGVLSVEALSVRSAASQP